MNAVLETQALSPSSPAGTAPASKVISLTSEQQLAVQALLDFIADPEPPSMFFTFAGYAGVGKTFCMREVVARCSKSLVKFAFTAPTNKAAKELRKVTGSATTIYSLLGLRIDKTGELKQVVAGKSSIDLSDYDAILIDEASMINVNLMNILSEKAAIYKVKIIFMGDKAQLPPVKESISPVWKLPVGASLEKVMRHDNQILTLVTEVREVMNSLTPSIRIKSNNDGNEGVWKLSKREFWDSIYDSAVKGEFADGAAAKVVAWRNVKVAEYNALIRFGIYGAAAVPGHFLPGERIVAASPCMRQDESLLATDDEALVEKATPCKHPFDHRYLALELMVRTELNKVVRLLVIHPDSEQQFAADSQTLAEEAKANGRLWKKFWDHKDLFHEVKYAYALTTHRAQGSTYTNVWVDSTDILMNRNRLEAFQCLYVACSRPTTRLRVM